MDAEDLENPRKNDTIDENRDGSYEGMETDNQNAGEKFLGTRRYCASNWGAVKAHSFEGRREETSNLSIEQGDMIEGIERHPDDPNLMKAELRSSTGAPRQGGMFLPNDFKTFWIDTSSIKGEWKVDRRPDPTTDEVPFQRNLGKKRINELLDRKRFLSCRKGDLSPNIQNLVLQAVEKTLQTKITPPLSRHTRNRPPIQPEI